MYPKSTWEKIGDLLARPGKRFLLGLLSMFVLGPFGVFIALSILGFNKDFFVANITVKTPEGDVPCAIIKRKNYAYMPVVPFVCLFFYVPYKTDYYLVKNYSAQDLSGETRVSGILLNTGLIPFEQLTKAKAEALQKDPQIIAREVSGVEQLREGFLQAVKPYFDTGLMEEIFASKYYSVCNLEGSNIVFHYGTINGKHLGFRVKETAVEEIKQNKVDLLGIYLQTDPQALINSLIVLDDELLERLLREQKNTAATAEKAPEEKPAPAEIVPEAKPAAVEKAPEVKPASAQTAPAPEVFTARVSEPEAAKAKKVLSDLDKNKKKLTRQIVEQSLKSKTSTSKKTLGIVLCFLALGCVELTVAGFATGEMVIGGVFSVASVFMIYWAAKKLRQAKENKEHTLAGKYKVVKVTCVEYSKRVVEDSESTTTYYTMKFSNGESREFTQFLGIQGDIFYLVYLPEAKEANLIFKGIEYAPAEDLIFEEK